SRRQFVNLESLEPRTLLSAALNDIATFDSETLSNAHYFVRSAAGDFFILGTLHPAGQPIQSAVYEVPGIGGDPTLVTAFDSSISLAGLAVDSKDDLFSPDDTGGAFNGGAVFEIPAGSHSANLVASFNQNTTGNDPAADLAIDANDNLFGTTCIGGDFNHGTVWELPANGNTINKLASFDQNAADIGDGIFTNPRGIT